MILKGKKIAFLGDSITEGMGVGDLSYRYDNIILREHGLRERQNAGVSGTRLAHQSVPSQKPSHDLCFCGRARLLDDDADICVVYGGVNDYLHGDAYIGTEADTTPVTFHGGVNFIMNFLKEKYAGKTVVFMTPARCYADGTHDTSPSPREMKKPDAMPLVGYVDIIIEAGRRHGIPVLDLYRGLPIDPNKPEDYERYTADGLHFNEEGQKVLAKTLADFLKAL